MSGSQNLKIRPLDAFRRSVENLTRTRYRKDQKGRLEFTELIKDLIKGLAQNPEPHRSRKEPWPKRVNQPRSVQFRKFQFRMPRLNGASQQGRLLYLVDREQKLLTPVLVYTHAEFAGRPPERSLTDLDGSARRSQASAFDGLMTDN